ncbi:hypothetical protein [Candidatus Nucleicultrix amoebiphila]|jgi:hypothetical protein|uniref:Uncharacterized protein n=1 Tax=Candidatus Nucleicultrix amoebiphila FS5 TaxID=1414854 RepID=A0A1W6N3I9_9PROT|nr:hypothetical protein [Candidatus Nucleicultrix amoebiphila]ARN84321.1 hypothetical protein GQ61_02075 [Candidatus Nucleicultrix amoebiphila FS5]
MVAPILTAAMTLAEMAPMIARWFSGDTENSNTTQMIAGRVVDIAKKLTGTNTAATAVEVLQRDPKLLIEFQRTILKLDRDLERAFLQDRMSARRRDMALVAAGKNNTRADVMVVSAAFGLLSCLISLAFYKDAMPGEAVGIISTIAGIFGACLKDAYAFEFGSSRGSKNKDLAVMMSAMESNNH